MPRHPRSAGAPPDFADSAAPVSPPPLGTAFLELWQLLAISYAMPDTSNPFRRPHSERSLPTSPMDEKLFESIFGVQEPRVVQQPTEGRAKEVSNEDIAAGIMTVP